MNVFIGYFQALFLSVLQSDAIKSFTDKCLFNVYQIYMIWTVEIDAQTDCKSNNAI